MKRASLFAMSILLCVFVASFSFLSPVNAAPFLRTTGVPNTYKDLDGGVFYVWGEVLNEGDAPAGSITLQVSYTDYEGWPLVAGSYSLLLPVIHPGETAPFAIQYSGPELNDIENAEFSFEFSPTGTLPRGLEIVSHSSDSPGTVVGVIKNIGAEPTTEITVAAMFYFGSGLLAATASDSIAGTLNPGQNATFNIAFEHTNLVPGIESYALIAQSQEYNIIPEFPLWTSMLLILVMLTVAIAISKRRLLRTPIH